MSNYADEVLFILRRAWTVGACTRKDVERAFGTHRSPALSAKLMRAAIQQWPAHLSWKKWIGILPVRTLPCPAEAQASEILRLVESGAPSSATGIFGDDGVPILRPAPLAPRAQTEQATAVILQAAVLQQPLRILYVGLKRNESPRWRRVWPSALEFTGMYWRLHAQDMEDEAARWPIKVFVLYRVIDAAPADPKDTPEGFQRREIVRSRARLRVSLNESLTPEQAQAIKNGLGISSDGTMTWPTHSLYEFKREWAGAPVPGNVVWPLMSRIDEVE
jgi:hypothetical protein